MKMLRVTVAALKGQRDVEILLENTSCRMNFILTMYPKNTLLTKQMSVNAMASLGSELAVVRLITPSTVIPFKHRSLTALV